MLDGLDDLTHSAGEYGLEFRAYAAPTGDLAGNLLPSGGTATWQMGHVWHNHLNAFDVSGQDGVTPLDVLILINYINAHPNQVDLPAPPPLPPPHYDVSNDGDIDTVGRVAGHQFPEPSWQRGRRDGRSNRRGSRQDSRCGLSPVGTPDPGRLCAALDARFLEQRRRQVRTGIERNGRRPRISSQVTSLTPRARG
jgi:hypothetical protein